MEVINFLHWELNPDMVIARWSTLGPVSTGMGDRVWVQFPVQDIFSLSEWLNVRQQPYNNLGM